jgi:hypothetical protein
MRKRNPFAKGEGEDTIGQNNKLLLADCSDIKII